MFSGFLAEIRVAGDVVTQTAEKKESNDFQQNVEDSGAIKCYLGFATFRKF